MRPFIMLSLCLLVLATAGCQVGSLSPLYKPDNMAQDKRIEGCWRLVSRDQSGEGQDAEDEPTGSRNAFAWVIVQIIIIDLVFSLDSIITAIGMAEQIEVMVAAVVIACAVMYVASGPVAAFVAEHPTTKMLALAFLVLIGMALMADGFGVHIPRGYVYSAIVFAIAVESFNILAKRKRLKGTRVITTRKRDS